MCIAALDTVASVEHFALAKHDVFALTVGTYVGHEVAELGVLDQRKQTSMVVCVMPFDSLALAVAELAVRLVAKCILGSGPAKPRTISAPATIGVQAIMSVFWKQDGRHND